MKKSGKKSTKGNLPMKSEVLSNLTLRHITRAYMNLTSANGDNEISINFRNDGFRELSMNIMSDGTASSGNFTPDLSHYLNSYLYTRDSRPEIFRHENENFIDIPIVFNIDGDGNLSASERFILR